MKNHSLQGAGYNQKESFEFLLLVKFTKTSQGKGFSVGSEGKASACNAGDLGSIPGSGRSPGEENGNPLQYSCLENPMDEEACRLWSIVGYSLWGRKESDMTEQLHFHFLKEKGIKYFCSWSVSYSDSYIILFFLS